MKIGLEPSKYSNLNHRLWMNTIQWRLLKQKFLYSIFGWKEVAELNLWENFWIKEETYSFSSGNKPKLQSRKLIKESNQIQNHSIVWYWSNAYGLVLENQKINFHFNTSSLDFHMKSPPNVNNFTRRERTIHAWTRNIWINNNSKVIKLIYTLRLW